MKNTTPLLPGFHLSTLRRKPRAASQKLAEERARIREKSISQLCECLGSFIPAHELNPAPVGDFSRRRLFSKENTFWGFFSQVLDADGGCQEVVHRFQAFAAAKGAKAPSLSTAAYCNARSKLQLSSLENILLHTAAQLKMHPTSKYWLDRRVVVVDGTGLSMPDTQANQQVWPQPRNQLPGCGFPQARLCACFCLQTGALLSYRIGSRKIHELPLLRQQWQTFQPGDIFVGDKGFCSYYDVAQFRKREVDSVIPLARRHPVKDSEAMEVLGPDDLLIKWPKPQWNKQLSYTKEEWAELPDYLTLRQIKVTVKTPGFRVREFYIVTTLTDPNCYPADALADLYYQRWDVELYFRDLKTTLGMDILRCKSPEMVQKEILMHLIVYNCIRHLMLEAADQKGLMPRQLSVKASIQALRQWLPLLNRAVLKPAEQRRLVSLLQDAIAATVLPERRGRVEPRCVKRRPKPFRLMTKPRSVMQEALVTESPTC
ncbi:IS4 family transposase [Marinobacterium mangrovicola]|uniref:DDE family transposase n=1 Tax=Marinobacterium mangrovicola TaxID=1476959 RepID=A0A4R1GE38_9GAMM|nr:IS4 family transposase [Marinobacterium mangrovicola]TCK06168.1 DDE family transposase [Marinobacterium mangrovicola]